jgi:NH3-dependent NAD+ synthetase
MTGTERGTLPVIDVVRYEPSLEIDCGLAARWLEAFLSDELIQRRGIRRAVVGLSGGVDSAVTAYLCARALGPENVTAVRMPYRTSSTASLSDAQLRDRCAGLRGAHDRHQRGRRRLLALRRRCRSAPARQRDGAHAHARAVRSVARLNALPVGTGNKTERLMGYFTWHADDTPPVNPIGDLYQDASLGAGAPSRRSGRGDRQAAQRRPRSRSNRRGDMGITYAVADRILAQILAGYATRRSRRAASRRDDVALVRRRVEGTHWKRHLPTTALVSAPRSTNSTCDRSTFERDEARARGLAARVLSGRSQRCRPPLRGDRRKRRP